MNNNIDNRFSFNDSFSVPAVLLKFRANKKFNVKFEAGSVEYSYNSYGYRTYEFDTIKENYVLLSGCSHSEGVGLPLESSYCKLLEKNINMPIINLGAGGSNATFSKKNIMAWIHSKKNLPEFVIVQWPNPYRLSIYTEKISKFEVVQAPSSSIIHTMVKLSDSNFLDPWLSAIIDTNNILQLMKIPCYNIHFQTAENFPKEIITILNSYNIKMYFNNHDSESIWLLDNNALDKSHHSAICHAQWANRLKEIINE